MRKILVMMVAASLSSLAVGLTLAQMGEDVAPAAVAEKQ
jgi:hypothetical protein